MEIPLFPLPNLVLFPRIVVPLHIFEERYKLMINSCIDRDEAFGLVLLQSGAEEEAEETIHRVGVTAKVIEVERLEDGRMNIVTEGERRFRIYRFTQQNPYWKASVDFFDDDESHHSIESFYEQVSVLYRKVCELGARLGESAESAPALPESASDLSYLVSYVLDIDAEGKQKLLEIASAAERLQVLVGHLNDAIRKLEGQLAYRGLVTKVRGNGDLGKPHEEN